jgi:hypothetical protein
MYQVLPLLSADGATVLRWDSAAMLDAMQGAALVEVGLT